jgi:hypothetical protein
MRWTSKGFYMLSKLRVTKLAAFSYAAARRMGVVELLLGKQ